MAEIATLHVEVVELDESDRLCLLRHYPGELDPRPARMRLNLETGRLCCEIKPKGTMPEALRNGREIAWHFSEPPTAEQANAVMRRCIDAAQIILDSAKIECDGRNRVGRLGLAGAEKADWIDRQIREMETAIESSEFEEAEARAWPTEADDLEEEQRLRQQHRQQSVDKIVELTRAGLSVVQIAAELRRAGLTNTRGDHWSDSAVYVIQQEQTGGDDREGAQAQMVYLQSTGLTLEAIANVLNTAGYRTPHGRPWRSCSVWHTLRRLKSDAEKGDAS